MMPAGRVANNNVMGLNPILERIDIASRVACPSGRHEVTVMSRPMSRPPPTGQWPLDDDTTSRFLGQSPWKLPADP